MTTPNATKIEELDIKILKILSLDGRKNKSTIAEDLKRSPNTIIKHIQDLEEEGIIKNYGVQIDFEKLGYEIIAIIEITIDKGRMIEVEKSIAQDPHIFAVYDITGEYDALFMARFQSRNDLNALIKKIHKFQYVQRTNTHLVLNVIKENDSFKKLIELDKQRE
ncbi:MAG: Lrp/AsnC family transcriptional regulator [Promethearchaeota archaeon]|jgi:DNA-binding Lrp family transcriptional regulator